MEIIQRFMENTHSQDDWIRFCKDDILRVVPGSNVEALFNWAVSNAFFEAPASTKYHGSSRGGLVKHSLVVVEELDKLLDAWGLQKDQDVVWYKEAMIAGFFHDLCKAQLYIPILKWRKDSNGKWESYMGYDIHPTVIQIGHGSESLRLIERFYPFKCEAWAQAVNWHMGMPTEWADKQQYMRVLEKYPEVLAMHTADMRAVTRWAS